ncbi:MULTISPECIES: hypothetical protein [unclassified Sphingopyxis]|jgi:hypothetical protein|uniref:hypothetical protein n=1 Tax=unclassified Sphingopyxis TaxID=2614943 RepID=UPI0006C699F3|nr:MULTISPECIES: hypothetical protein [unclassified Sphingopyxis]USI76059.1 hypothetical protein KEC45_14945 [Sphingopyxis sp. USTB-05]GAO77274.1 hypothetical protein SC1_00564 [Sphingopyxis sp. C-1]
MSHIAPIPSPGAIPAQTPTPTPTAAAPALDAHGHDPAVYDWIPVLKKRRHDGWSPDKQRAFIEALADCGSVACAARAVNMSESSAYRLRRAPGAEAFDRAWGAAIDAASKKLLDAAFERALVGTDEPVFNREGNRVGRRLRQSDRLLMFLLRAYGPDCFRSNAAGQAAPTAPPVAEALVHLHPEPPAAPAALMAPEDLAVALEVADLGEGELPHWYRDGPAEAVPVSRAMPAPDTHTLDDEAELY